MPRKKKTTTTTVETPTPETPVETTTPETSSKNGTTYITVEIEILTGKVKQDVNILSISEAVATTAMHYYHANEKVLGANYAFDIEGLSVGNIIYTRGASKFLKIKAPLEYWEVFIKIQPLIDRLNQKLGKNWITTHRKLKIAKKNK